MRRIDARTYANPAFPRERRHGTAPAVSTIWRVLTARGFVTPQPHKRPKSSYVRFAAEQPNERWQTDITHWALADGTEVEILNVVDDHSRLCLASTARPVFKAADVDAAFRHAAATYGDPASLLSDNAAVFTGRYRRLGRVTLEVTLNERGIIFTHSRPYHPQTCGKVERFHQTLKRWARQPTTRTVHRRAPGPTRPLPPLLQHRPAPPGPRPAHPHRRLPGPPQSPAHRHQAR